MTNVYMYKCPWCLLIWQDGVAIDEDDYPVECPSCHYYGEGFIKRPTSQTYFAAPYLASTQKRRRRLSWVVEPRV